MCVFWFDKLATQKSGDVLAKGEGEDAKISVRNARQDANKEIKKVEASDDVKKEAEERVQKLTDKYIKKVEEVLAVKEAEILKV